MMRFIRTLIFIALVLLFGYYFFTHYHELITLQKLAHQANVVWLALALATQIIYYVLFTEVYSFSFRAFGIKRKFRDLWPVIVGSISLNVLTPLGNLAGITLFVDDAKQSGFSSKDAVSGSLLAIALDYIGFLPFLLAGIVLLMQRKSLNHYELVATVLFLCLAAAIVLLILALLYTPAWVRVFYQFIITIGKKLHLAPKSTHNLPTGIVSKLQRNKRDLFSALGIAIVSHAVNLFSLFMIFQAFSIHASASVLLATYATSILLLIISFSPQGIGIVEPAMILAMTAEGVSPVSAVLVTATFRMITLWLPFVIGFLVLKRTRSFQDILQWTTEWKVRLIALATALLGGLIAFSSLGTFFTGLVTVPDWALPSYIRQDTRFGTALIGLALFVFAQSLWRRKRAAWFLTIIAVLIASVSFLLKGFDIVPVLALWFFAAWLYSLQPLFYAHSDLPSTRRGLFTISLMVLFVLGYGLLGFYMFAHRFNLPFSLNGALGNTFLLAVPFYDAQLDLPSRAGFFALSIDVMGWIIIGYGLYLLSRPSHSSVMAQTLQIKEIVSHHDTTRNSRIALFPDKSYFVTKHKTVIAYKVSRRVAIALGDPIGPKEDLTTSIQSYLRFSYTHDWLPVFYQVMPETVTQYERLGLKSLCIGHEAMIDLTTYTIAVPELKQLRNSVNKVERLGYTATMHHPPYSSVFIQELRWISNQWLVQHKGAEKQFSLGWFEESIISTQLIMTIQDPHNTIVGFITLIPYDRDKALGVDLMRYAPHFQNGIMDYLMYQTIIQARESGFTTFNLGLSPLYQQGKSSAWQHKIMNQVFHNFNYFYNFRGLQQFKAKFNPSWEARYLIYPSDSSLPALIYAIIQANSGEPLWLSFILALFRRGKR